MSVLVFGLAFGTGSLELVIHLVLYVESFFKRYILDTKEDPLSFIFEIGGGRSVYMRYFSFPRVFGTDAFPFLFIYELLSIRPMVVRICVVFCSFSRGVDRRVESVVWSHWFLY